MKITNVQWSGEESKMCPSLYFDLDDRPCSATAEQHLLPWSQGYLYIFFEEGPSPLPVRTILPENGDVNNSAKGDHYLYSHWLIERMKETREYNQYLGDCPEEAY
jgi:hypothetical protein